MEKYFASLVFAFLFVVTIASANRPTTNTDTSGDTTNPRTSRLMENPSKEAVDSCGGKNVGATCTYTGPNATTATGTCTKPTDSDLLACRETTPRTVR